MDIIEKLLEDPERTVLASYASLGIAATAYIAVKNDFGANRKTCRDLEDYLEDVEDGFSGPLEQYKSHIYRKELESREDCDFEY